MVKPRRKVYRRNNKDILFRPGDIIKCSKGVDVVRGWASTQHKIITEKLKKASEYFDIKILDHIIVADDKYFSFADESLI